MVFINQSGVNNANVHDCSNGAGELYNHYNELVLMRRKPEGNHKAMIDVNKSKTEQVMQPKHQSVE